MFLPIIRCHHRYHDGTRCKNTVINMDCDIYAYCDKHNKLHTEIFNIIR